MEGGNDFDIVFKKVVWRGESFWMLSEASSIIQFCKVKDISKVDLRPEYFSMKTDVDEHIHPINSIDDDFESYLAVAKENCTSILKAVKWEYDCARQAYVVEGITIPSGTDVIRFANFMFSPQLCSSYIVRLYYDDPAKEYNVYIGSSSRANAFMIIPKYENPIRMVYELGCWDGDVKRIHTEADLETFVAS